MNTKWKRIPDKVALPGSGDDDDSNFGQII